jgi:small neutral amino acid transporter SnatA (MarC family)
LQLLDTGFFHADPHPGNMIRTPDGNLAILDFGVYFLFSFSLLIFLYVSLDCETTNNIMLLMLCCLDVQFIVQSISIFMKD